MSEKRFYTVSVWYDTADEGVKCYTVHNLSPEYYMRFREEIFFVGLQLKDPDDPTCGELVPPWRIVHCKWFTQKCFFKDEKAGFNKQMKKETT